MQQGLLNDTASSILNARQHGARKRRLEEGTGGELRPQILVVERALSISALEHIQTGGPVCILYWPTPTLAEVSFTSDCCASDHDLLAGLATHAPPFTKKCGRNVFPNRSRHGLINRSAGDDKSWTYGCGRVRSLEHDTDGELPRELWSTEKSKQNNDEDKDHFKVCIHKYGT